MANVSNSFQLSDLHGKNSENTTEQETRSKLTKVKTVSLSINFSYSLISEMQVPWAFIDVTTETHIAV